MAVPSKYLAASAMANQIQKISTDIYVLSIPCGENAHLCDAGGEVFSRKAAFKRRMKTHAGIKLSCDKTQGKIPENITTASDIPSLPAKAEKYACETCGKVCSSQAGLKRHMRFHADLIKKVQECDICGRVFHRRSDMNTHMYIHTGIKKYVCDLCGKKFARKSNLKQHMDAHTGEMNFRCDVCGKGFVRMNNLTAHMGNHKKHRCDMCGKELTSKRELQCHFLRVHCGAKSHKCGVCHKEFPSKRSLRAHEAWHARTKHLKFSHKLTLNSRIDPHADRRNFKCDQCGKGFTLNSNLIHHKELHANEKHKCHICEKEFMTKRYLKSHLLVHSETRDHKCGICEKAFTHKASMKRHEISHAGIRNYQCATCGTKFTQKSSLKSHMKLHAARIAFGITHLVNGRKSRRPAKKIAHQTQDAEDQDARLSRIKNKKTV